MKRDPTTPAVRRPAVAASGWLRRAAAMLAEHPDLEASAATVRGFGDGGLWMARALSTMRNGDSAVARDRDSRDPRFVALGIRKYGLCLLAGGSAAAISSTAGPALSIGIGLLVFYAVEARHVFDFPAAIDYERRARMASRALHRRAGGTITLLTRILPIAAFMLFGWLVRGRPRANFALGCLAVLLWYESLRRREDTTPCVLELGSSAPLSIRRVGDVDPGPDAIRILYASDLHLGTYGASRAMRELQRVTIRERPDVVLLGGDLVNSREALPELLAHVRRLQRFAPVAAVPGNHDTRWLAEVASVVRDAGARWLLDRPLLLRGLRIDGVPTRYARDGRRRLLCAHRPEVFESATTLGYDLVMAGHLHGGQMILFDVRGRHYPGALHSRWTGPEFTAEQATLWVSRGLHDTLPIRFRCPREVILATLRRDGPSSFQEG